MQIGRRWLVGATAPTELPPAVIAAIASEEAELVSIGADTRTWYWTLTYLEGRPVATLDDGTEITFDGHTATVSR